MPIIIGAFPSDIEPLLGQKLRGYDFKFLTAANTPEEQWVTSFLKPKEIIRYQLDSKHPSIEKNSFTTIFTHSTITTAIKRAKITHLWLTVNNQDRQALARWSKRHGVGIVGPEITLQKKLEHKIWFDGLLEKNHIPKPASLYWQPFTPLRMPGPLVVQKPLSDGGEGTFFLAAAAEARKRLTGNVTERETLLVRSRVNGISLGITILITKNIIALSALRQQCFSPINTSGKKEFLGIQWLPTRRLKHLSSINRVCHELGSALRRNNFYGLANVDFIIDQHGEINIIECNPRLSMATTQLMAFPKQMSDLPVAQRILDDFFNKNIGTTETFVGVPKTDFAGSVLNIKAKNSPSKKFCTIVRPQPIGVYAATAGNSRFITSDVRKFSTKTKQHLFFTLAKRGERFQAGTDIGLIISNYSLFNTNGELTTHATHLLNQFQPC